MSYSKSDPKFPGVIKTLDDRPVESGTITVSQENKSVEFRGEFVPLYNRGEHLKIVRTQDGVEVISYTGEVYLSSPQMLRIVSITEEMLPGARSVFLYDVDLPAKLQAELTRPPKGKFGLFHRKPQPHEEVLAVRVHAVSLRQIKFTTEELLDETQPLLLSLEEPRLQKVQLTINHMIDLGQSKRGYKCSITSIDAASRSNLESYISYLSTQNSSFR